MVELSIIIPIYNTETSKLNRCIESIKSLINLLNNNIECILVDDGSSDYVEKYIKSNYEDEQNFIYIKKENGGASSARNLGIKVSSGKYLMFVDADDEIISDAIADMLKNCDSDLILSDLIFINDDKKCVWKALPSKNQSSLNSCILSQLSKSGKLNGPVCKLINRNIILNNNLLFLENMVTGEDAVFFYKVLETKPNIKYIEQPTYIYYYDKNTTENRIKKHSEHILDDYQIQYKSFENLLACLELNSKEIEEFRINSTQKYVKNIFNTMITMSCMNIMGSIQKEQLLCAINTIEAYHIEKNKLNMGTKVRLYLIHKNLYSLNVLISKIRSIYIYVKRLK